MASLYGGRWLESWFYGLCFRYLYHDIHAGFSGIQAYGIFLDAVWTFNRVNGDDTAQSIRGKASATARFLG